MEADEASMTSPSQECEDDFERNKVTHVQIELGLSLFFNPFSSLEAIYSASPCVRGIRELHKRETIKSA